MSTQKDAMCNVVAETIQQPSSRDAAEHHMTSYLIMKLSILKPASKTARDDPSSP